MPLDEKALHEELCALSFVDRMSAIVATVCTEPGTHQARACAILSSIISIIAARLPRHEANAVSFVLHEIAAEITDDTTADDAAITESIVLN